MADRIPPHDLETERVILAELCTGSQFFAQLCALLTPDSFFSPAHRRMFEAIGALAAAREPVNIITVVGRLRDTGHLVEVGETYAADVVDATVAVLDPVRYAERLRLLAAEREVIRVCQRVVAEGYGGPGEPRAWLVDVQDRIAKASRVESRSALVHISDVAKRAFAEIQKAVETPGGVIGLTTGLRDLDAVLGGLVRGTMVVIAGRPGMGKSAVAGNLATEAADRNRTGSLFIALEMRDAAVVKRAILGRAKTSVNALRADSRAWPSVTRSADSMSRVPMWFYDKSLAARSIEPLVIEAKALAERDGHELGIVTVDYTQLIQSSGKYAAREAEVADVSRALKRISRDHNVCVLALSQLNRQCEERADKRPMLSDLRESGQLEQDADAVLMLYRDWYYTGRNTDGPDDHVLEVLVAKNREGRTGRVCVFYDTETSHISDLERW